MPPSMVGGYRHLRGQVPAQHLPAVIVDSAIFDPDLQQGPTAIFPSKIETEGELHGIQQAKQHGLRVVLDVEDNHLADRGVRPEAVGVRYEGPMAAVLQLLNPPVPSRWQRDAILSRRERLHRDACHLADLLITATEQTASAYQHLGKPVLVIPNAIDPDQWPDVERSRSGTLRVGIAVSPSHGDDLPLVVDALRWASEQPGVEVIVVGVDPREPTWTQYRAYQELLADRARMEPLEFAKAAFAWAEQDRLRRDAWGFPFRHIGISTYDDYRRLLGTFHIGLAPLIENEWSKCRSDSKAIEYANAGVLPICSNTQPYQPWADRPLPLANNAGDFLELVQHLVRHQDEIPPLAQQANTFVLEQRTINNTIDLWHQVIDA